MEDCIKNYVPTHYEKWLEEATENNLKYLYDEDFMSQPDDVMFCETDEKLTEIPMVEFLFLAYGWCYVDQNIGSKERVKYYLHIPSNIIYELYFHDHEDICVGYPDIVDNAKEAVEHVQEFDSHTINKAGYRAYKIKDILS